jgi:hypothetical protein
LKISTKSLNGSDDILLLSKNRVFLRNLSNYEKALFLVIKEEADDYNNLLKKEGKLSDEDSAELFKKHILVDLAVMLLKSELELYLGYKISKEFGNVNFCEKFSPKDDSEMTLLTPDELDIIFSNEDDRQK